LLTVGLELVKITGILQFGTRETSRDVPNRKTGLPFEQVHFFREFSNFAFTPEPEFSEFLTKWTAPKKSQATIFAVFLLRKHMVVDGLFDVVLSSYDWFRVSPEGGRLSRTVFFVLFSYPIGSIIPPRNEFSNRTFYRPKIIYVSCHVMEYAMKHEE